MAMMITNLPSGYHRDLQLLKESLFPAFSTLKDCLRMASLMLENIHVNKDILKDEKYRFLFSVEEVNKLVLQGVPFRDAYKKVGRDIESGAFSHTGELHHTHEGSLGNLCNEEIAQMMIGALREFPFAKTQAAIALLLQE
jgi:argininosuccinate lyase